MMDGKQLNGSVIKEVEVESESSCRLECVNEERCKSYNFDDWITIHLVEQFLKS